MESPSKKAWWQPAMTIFGQVTSWIVAPILIALFLGKYLDEKNGSDPWFFLGLTGMAFMVSCIGIARIASKYIKQIEQEDKKSKQKNIDERTRSNN